MSDRSPAAAPHHDLLVALDAADAGVDPSHPSSFARDRAAYAEALHLSAPAHTRAATNRTLQRVAAFGITATALLVIGAGYFVPGSAAPPAAGEVRVQAWRVTGKGAEPLRPRDFVSKGDMLQLSVTAEQPRRVNVWTRTGKGPVEAWFGAEGTRIEAGERVPLEHHTIFDATPGTHNVAVQVCELEILPGPDPWTDVLPPDGCRPFLFTLKHRR